MSDHVKSTSSTGNGLSSSHNIRSAASFWFSSTTNKLIQGISSSVIKLQANRRSGRWLSRASSNTTNNNGVNNDAIKSLKGKFLANGKGVNSKSLSNSTMPRHASMGRVAGHAFSSRSNRANGVASRQSPQRKSCGNLSSVFIAQSNASCVVDSAWNQTNVPELEEKWIVNGNSPYASSLRRSSMYQLSALSGKNAQVTERCSIIAKSAWNASSPKEEQT